MNTIIYLYHSREKNRFTAEKYREEDYCLIRLGIPVPLWQSRTKKPLESKPSELKPSELKSSELKSLELKISDALWEELIHWQIALTLLGDNPHWTYCAYEGFLKEHICAEQWRKYWQLPEFAEYPEAMWVEKIIHNSIPGHYMILGYADCLPRLLCENVSKMRSIKWFLKPEQYTSELQNFIEDFYEEYGLAVEMHPVEEGWGRVHLRSPVPVNLWDFTGEEKLSSCDVAAGSIWLDMCSVEDKNRRIEVRNPEISYFSLKKQWKQRQKEGFHLDTIHKNGYNTIVK